MNDIKLRIKITADDRNAFTAMFEPVGMIYDIAPGSHIYAEVERFRDAENELEIIQWPGGISIWAPGAVTTYDAAGNKLDDLD